MESITNESNCGLYVTGLRYDYPNRRICCPCGGEIAIRLTSDSRAETYCLACEKPSPLGSFPVKPASGAVSANITNIHMSDKILAICKRFGYLPNQVAEMTRGQVEHLWDAVQFEKEERNANSLAQCWVPINGKSGTLVRAPTEAEMTELRRLWRGLNSKPGHTRVIKDVVIGDFEKLAGAQAARNSDSFSQFCETETPASDPTSFGAGVATELKPGDNCPSCHKPGLRPIGENGLYCPECAFEVEARA